MREWGQLVAADLFRPSFGPRAYALKKRLLRNYWAIFLVLLGSWAVSWWPTPSRRWIGGGARPHAGRPPALVAAALLWSRSSWP
jgi:uncharacterized membrane protein